MFVIVVLATAASLTAPAAPRVAFFRCGTELTRLNLQGDTAYLTVGRAQYTLRSTPSASGARYVGNDNEFWQNGETARLTIGKRAVADCVSARPLERRPYRAAGQEPGWSLVINNFDGSATFSYSDGRENAVEPLRQWFVATGGARVFPSVSGRLSVRAESDGCNDAMSGKAYPDTVVVTLRGKTYRGCGGRETAAASIAKSIEGMDWVVESVGGAAVIKSSRATIEMTKGRISGLGSCNRYTGHATVEGQTISVNPLQITMMACAPLVMAQERNFMALLQSARNWKIDPTGALVITNARGRTIVARKAA